MNMTYSKDGMALTEGFEKCRLMPYQDSGGVWTNGWGNTHHVIPGVAITQQKADDDLLANLQDAIDCVNDSVTIDLTQHQFDALVDFTFNAGVTAFKTSTLLKKLNAGDIDGAHDEMMRWTKVKGVTCAGLIHRREGEQNLFNEADA